MTVIPQCMYCKNGTIKEEHIVCTKYNDVPKEISSGNSTCKYHEGKKCKK